MAYDEQRSFTRPALQSVVHAEIDGRRMYGREQSVGFQYTNQTPFVQHGAFVSSPPSRSYAPTGPTHMAGPSRRPLPTPRNRPESMPPPPRHTPLVVQAPAPSRPAILSPSATLPTSPTAPPARRPLPTPVLTAARPTTKHSSIDLTTRPASPIKASVSNASSDQDLLIPSSFSRRTAPLPDNIQRSLPPAATFSTPPPAWPRSSRSDTHETQQSRVPPVWNRNLPAPSSVPNGVNVIGRRSTVSGDPPPAVAALRPDLRRAESSERAQSAQSSPPRRPLPSSPTEPPRVPSLHQRIPTSSEDDHISSPSDTSSLADRDAYEPMTFADPLQLEDEEHEIMFAKNVHVPSPKYGIRNLPTRSRLAIANRDDSQDPNAAVSGAEQEQATRSRPVRAVTHPQLPTTSLSSPPGQPHTAGLPPSPASGSFTPFADRNPPGSSRAEPQSLTLRFASMGLAEERERERERKTQQEAPNSTPAQSPIRTTSGPASPARQQGWPSNVPPLPRTPGNTSRPFFGTTDAPLQSQPIKSSGTPSSSPILLPTSPTHPARPFSSSPKPNATFDRKPFAQQPPRPPPHIQSQQVSQLSERQLQKQRARDADIDLDDAPPPSLRRSPSPIPQGFTRAPAEITNDSPPRRQWAPSQDVTSRSGNVNGDGANNSYVGFRAGSHSPERRGKPFTQPPVRSPTQPQQTAVPRISLPDGHRDDSDVDDGAFSPNIVVSGPGSGPSASASAPSVPAISISGAPSITVSEHRAPAISVSAVDSPSVTVSSPKTSLRDSAQSQRPRPSPGGFGSRHTLIQEPSSSHSAPSRGPGSKRGLPPPPSSSPMRTNGLSCGGCNGPIVGRIVSAMGQRWHPNCFKCAICNELLEHVSSYERDGRPYCHLDYHETFAPRCFHCKTAIIDERFITLDDPALGTRTYHEQHFFCAECGDPFLAPTGPLPPSVSRTGELNLSGDGEFVDDDVGFTVYKGHPYCEACHVRLRMPKCKGCKKSIRDGARAVEALGGKWCWGCFVCEGCKQPFEDPSFFLRNEKPFCEFCFSLILRNEV